MLRKTLLFLISIAILIQSFIYRIQDGVAPSVLVFASIFSLIYSMIYLSDLISYAREYRSNIHCHTRKGKMNGKNL